MSAHAIDEVWSMLDRDALCAVTMTGPEPLFATVSGAHLYGFASPDSDVDLRGAFVLPLRDLLGLRAPSETLEVSECRSGLDLDWVAHDVRKFARMMTRANGYALEQLYSPLVVMGGAEHDELREIGRGCMTRDLFRHYRGFAAGQRKRLSQPDPTVKHLLYAYRVYLTGIHVLRSARIEANLSSLNQLFELGQIEELMARKREGSEKLALAPGELAAHARELDLLEESLTRAHAESSLPAEPTSVPALEDFVVRARLRRFSEG